MSNQVIILSSVIVEILALVYLLVFVLTS